MSRTNSQSFGQYRIPTPSCSISLRKLESLEDLLDAIRQSEPERSHLTKMLGATVAHLAICLGEPPGKIFVRGLLDARPALRADLKAKGFRPNSVRSYINYVRILLQKAKELGWMEYPPELVAAWQDIRQLLRKAIGCSRIINFAIAQGKSPDQFTDSDLRDWAQKALEAGFNYEYVRIVKNKFRRLIVESPLRSAVPGLSAPVDNTYGIPFSELPDTLRAEVMAVLEWKTAEFAVGRPRRAKVRPICAFFLEREFCRLFGYLQKVHGKAVSSLRELLTEECLTGFATWCLNERGVTGRCVEIDLARICGLRYYPPLASHDFSWLPPLMAQLPRRDAAEIREKKAGRWIPYDTLRQIPAQIRRDAERALEITADQKAVMTRNALLMDFLTTLPWRQRNIREMKVLPFASGGNLYKEEIPAHSTMAMGQQVADALRSNPRERVWQFYFRKHETKTGRAVRGIVPRQLVKPLEEYLEKYRPILLNGHPDPGTLFFARTGRPFCRKGLRRIVGDLAAKYGGKRLHPHLVRDIFSVAYLRDHPRDFLTLSKILWHQDPGTTVKIYAAGFDESDGALAAEEWRDKRG